jgi:hypothetical protein
MDKTARLDDLFHRWFAESGSPRSRFHDDGIMNEEAYATAYPKLLFVAREPNRTGAQMLDVHTGRASKVHLESVVKIYEWAYGIGNGFPCYEDIPRGEEDMLAVIATLAFMHLRKTAEGGIVRPEEFEAQAVRDKQFIVEQIEIIAPDIVIGGIGDFGLWGKILGIEVDARTTYGIRVFRYKTMKVIDFFHPAYHIIGAALYSLLQNVFTSKVFRDL